MNERHEVRKQCLEALRFDLGGLSLNPRRPQHQLYLISSEPVPTIPTHTDTKKVHGEEATIKPFAPSDSGARTGFGCGKDPPSTTGY